VRWGATKSRRDGRTSEQQQQHAALHTSSTVPWVLMAKCRTNRRRKAIPNNHTAPPGNANQRALLVAPLMNHVPMKMQK
jgi:hypothetical protein